MNEHTSQKNQNTERQIYCVPNIDKMFSDCAQMLTYSTSCHVITGNLSQATGTLSSLLNCKVQFPCEMYSDVHRVFTCNNYADYLHRENNAERSVTKNTLCQQGHIKGKQRGVE